ncbi:GNAT family N-acetyltransferase [Aquimarina algiphila]|uniref:GNAT family N-acetyltransferase n=1 Tax=Aquimarina algiphila TaxID=2047982 RepID=A0A554VLE6_9FLAO|nr:GNAT family N-acetyltransferase [Aquimarina algiphila]TSE08939.1 GNAT family N-acetyltransferase [Aquimarina algiphila]
MGYKIYNVEESEYKELVDIWEASVRATHHFLKEENILYFKPLILNEYLKAVILKCVRNNDMKIIGFLGVAEQNLEMLFIHPNFIGKGVGKTLLQYAIKKLNVTKVDVNEDNQQALKFYEHHGFKIFDRSALDASGKPYPILYMQLDTIK